MNVFRTACHALHWLTVGLQLLNAPCEDSMVLGCGTWKRVAVRGAGSTTRRVVDPAPRTTSSEEVGKDEVERLMAAGRMVSSAFVVWQGDGEDRKGRFVVNLARQSKHWPKGSVKMETLPGNGPYL